jgi:hypothetical protein
MPRVTRVLADPVAKYLWMALFAVGVVVGWMTAQQWWAVVAFVLGGIIAAGVATVRRRRSG